jgi:methylamine dehydrogenase heavy chain
MRSKLALATLLLLASGAPRVRAADLAPESIGRVETLPVPPGLHWIWLEDSALRRTALFDADSGRLLGMLSGGLGTLAPDFSPDRGEIYLAETHYSRGTRGERSDVLSIYDAGSLRWLAEVQLPPKRAEHASGVASSALSYDGRFWAHFNLTPATSLSVVDVAARRFVAEISTPGCGLVYAAGARSFVMLCGDGALESVILDESGRERTKQRSAPFFDPQRDPVTEKAVRHGDHWLFVSFEGVVHPVDVSGEVPRFGETWSLLDDADRADSWRIGGAQHLAVHERSGRLYALMHRGGPDSHKEPGTQVWVYELSRRERVQRIDVRNPTAVFLGQSLGVDGGGLWARAADWLLQRLLPHPGADRILVTADESPVLITASAFPATLSVHDALSGEFLRDLAEVGIAAGTLRSR